MDLRQLNYFLEVANHGGFNRAASMLHVAQSALSRQVQLLEHELQTPLFVRGGAGVRLTPAGKILRARAEMILSHVRNARTEVMAEANEPRGEFLLGMPPSLERNLVVPLLAKMKRRYPDVFIKTWVATSLILREMLLDGAIDMAVIGVREAETALTERPLFSDPMYLVGPEGMLTEPEVSIDAIAELPLLLTSAPNSVRILVDQAALRRGKRLNVVMEANDVPVLFGLVREGIGCTLLPCSALDMIDRSGYSWSKVPDMLFDWVLVTQRETELTAAGRATYEMIGRIVDDIVAARSSAAAAT